VIWLRILVFLAAGAAACSAQAQIALRGANSASAAAPTTVTHVGAGASDDRDNCGNVTPGIPGGNVGDLLIATALSRESTSTLAFPATWTLLYSDSYPGQDLKVYIYYRFATGADGFTVSQTANCDSLAAQVSRFRGVDPAQPFYNVPIPGANVVRQNTNNIDTGTEASAGANDMMVVVSFVNDNRTVTQGAGWSASFDSSLNMGRDAGMALHYDLGGASSIANWALQGGGNDPNYGIIFALRPAGGLTIAVPAGTALDDVMIASIAVRPCSSTSGAACTLTVAAPAGWTLIRTLNQTTGAGTGGYGNRLLVYQRVATAAEPASYTWTFAGAPVHAGAVGSILSFSGVDTASPIVAEAGQTTASAFTHAAPSINTGTDINTVLVSSHSANSAASWTPPAGMTERVDVASLPVPDALGLSLEVNTQDFPTPGATGVRTATQSNPPAQDTGATHMLALRPLAAVLHWSMDQSSWNGTAGEVLDLTGNGLHGTGLNGATTANATQAIAGNPGTCQYGSLDGIDDFVQVADNALLDVTDELTVMAWVRPSALPTGGNLKTIVSKDQNYEFHLTSTGAINWWWGGGALQLTSAGTVPLNTWTHVAIVYSRAGAFQRIYINGAQDANTNNQNAALVPNNMPFEVGSDQGFAGRQFAGFIDEVRVYRAALSTSAIQTLRNQTRPCAASVNHFSISHAGSGVACVDQTITITSHDASHAAVDAGSVTINLSTSHGRGTWTGIVAGGGVLSDPTAGDGAATYTFAAGSNQVALSFRNTNLSAASETFSFNVVSGGISEASGTANASDDPSFTMAQAGFVFTAIPTQLSGKPSNTGYNTAVLAIQAVDTDAGTGSCTSLFASQSQTVELGAECNNPGACAGQSVNVNGTNLPTSNDNGVPGAGNYAGVSLAFNASSAAPIVISYPAAGQMSLHARYDLNPAVLGYEMIGSSNTYVVRPFGLRISGVTTDATPAPADPVFAKAGADFNVTVTAVQWEAADDVNADGVPDSDGAIAANAVALNFGLETVPATASLTHTLNAPAGGAAGTLGGSTGFGAFVNATRTQAVNWSEVGFINLFATTSNYLGAGDVTNSAVGLAGVGRFYPDHFFLSAGTLTNRIATACAATFTYMNEGIGLTYTLQARNTANAVTQNYTTVSGYARLDPATIAQLGLGAVGVNPALASTNLTARIDPSLGSGGSFVAGQAVNATATVPITRASPSVLDGPYANVRIGIAPVDSDSVALRAADLNLDVDGAGGNDRIQVGAATNLRFGRLRLENAVGSQTLDLPIAMRAEYWAGTAFVTNGDDGCTSIAAGNIAFGNYQGGITAGNVNAANLSGLGGTFAAGVGNFTLLRPSGAPPAAGSVDICVDLGADTTPPPTCAAGTPAGRSYLQGRNAGANYDDDPVARAAFGLFGAQPNNFIYFRENF
jgi:MSHA biogenesis protein MshQ